MSASGKPSQHKWVIRETGFDRMVARAAARHATPRLERPLKRVTLLADERLLLAATAGLWLASRLAGGRDRRRADHLALSVVASAILPHLLKHLVAQTRPDRRMVHGRRHGIPKSGRATHAFPSGHAVHIGAICAAAGRFFPRWRGTAWGLGLTLASTRILLLAHWAGDVAAGLGIGVAVEAATWRLVDARRKAADGEGRR